MFCLNVLVTVCTKIMKQKIAVSETD